MSAVVASSSTTRTAHARTPSRRILPEEVRERLLADQERDHEQPRAIGRKGVKKMWQQAPLAQRSLFCILTTFLLFILFGSLAFHRRSHLPLKQSLQQKSQYLYLAIPAEKAPDGYLCRSVLTAQILNYPVPTLIQWDPAYFDPNQPTDWQRSQFRLAGTADWLNKLPPEHDNGIVILLDGPTTWFQLRPEVLLKRYYDINRRANEKLKSKTIKQSILFGAQHTCSPNPDSEKACASGQNSPLIPSPTHRARYLDSAFLVGPVSEVRSLIKHVAQKSQAFPGASPQELFGAVFTEQENQRRRASSTRDPSFEMGIGLDYHNEIGYSTSLIAPSEDPETFFTPQVYETRPNSSTQLPLDPDIESSMAPFWTVSGSEPDLPHGTSWWQVPLLRSPSHPQRLPPALIHHSTETHRELLDGWWGKLWLVPYARSLYTASIHFPPSVVASVVDAVAGVERHFWQQYWQLDKTGVRLAGEDDKWQDWHSLCGYEPETGDVFGDGRGWWLGMWGW